MRLFSASLRKSLTDVTRRKGRTLLVVLGIFIGVAGSKLQLQPCDPRSESGKVHSGQITAQPENPGLNWREIAAGRRGFGWRVGCVHPDAFDAGRQAAKVADKRCCPPGTLL